MANENRLIDAYTLAEEIESLQITVAGKPAKWNDARHSVLRVIAEQADVDAVEVVHGEWIYENGEWVCSVCKEPALYEVQVYGGGNYKDCDLVRSNYCPNCGAKMDGERKDND